MFKLQIVRIVGPTCHLSISCLNILGHQHVGGEPQRKEPMNGQQCIAQQARRLKQEKITLLLLLQSRSPISNNVSICFEIDDLVAKWNGHALRVWLV